MKRSAEVFRNSTYAGILSEAEDGTFKFEYNSDYLRDAKNPAISLTMPTSNKVYVSKHLFPFFFNMLAEGVNKQVQLRQLQISKNDHFGLLLATSSIDTIGAIRVKEIIAHA
jgi:serine/threonine-protein kinase HipA